MRKHKTKKQVKKLEIKTKKSNRLKIS